MRNFSQKQGSRHGFLKRLASITLAVSMILSSGEASLLNRLVYAKDSDSADNTDTSISGRDNASSEALTGGMQFTNLSGNAVSDVTVDGVYIYQDDTTAYIMFTNKKTSDANIFYRTVGFNFHPKSTETLSTDTDNPHINLALPDAYPSDYPSNYKMPDSDFKFEYGGPGDSSITSSNHSVSYGDTTTTCFKVNKDTLLKAFNSGSNVWDTKNTTGYLSAINIIRYPGLKGTENNYYVFHSGEPSPSWLKYSSEDLSLTQEFFDAHFSDRSQKSIKTYYNIPVDLVTTTTNAATVIDVSGTSMKAIETKTVTSLDDTLTKCKFTFNSTYTADDGTKYKVMSAAFVPYNTMGIDTTEKVKNGESPFITWTQSLGGKSMYYPTFLDHMYTEAKAKLSNRYGESFSAWYQPDSGNNVTLTNCVTQSISSSNTLQNNSTLCGSQLYLFVVPQNEVATDNLVIYNNATGAALATGYINYDAYDTVAANLYENHKGSDNSSADVTGHVSLTNLALKDAAKVEDGITGKVKRNERTTSFGTDGLTEASSITYGGDSYINGLGILTLKFPTTITTVSGQKLQFKGTEVVFNTTVEDDISSTSYKAGSTINLSVDGKSTLADYAISKGATLSEDYTNIYKLTEDQFKEIAEAMFNRWSNITTAKSGSTGTYASEFRELVLPTRLSITQGLKSANESAYYITQYNNRLFIENIPNMFRINETKTTFTFPNYNAKIYSYGTYETNLRDFSDSSTLVKINTPLYDTAKANVSDGTIYNNGVVLPVDYRTDLKTGNAVGNDASDDGVTNYIVRAVYEPASVPVLYYYKDGLDNIQLGSTADTTRADSTTVKNSLVIDGKRYYTKAVSYRRNTTKEEDIRNTTASSEIMISPPDENITEGSITIDTSDIPEDTDYVIRVELSQEVQTNTVSTNYQIGTFKIPDNYLNKEFTYNSMKPTPKSVAGDGEGTMVNSDSYTEKHGVFKDSTKTEYGDEYNTQEMSDLAIFSEFDHYRISQLYKPHTDSAHPDITVSGDEVRGTITKFYTETVTDSDGDSVDVTKETSCTEIIKYAFGNPITKWDNSVESVFGSQIGDTISDAKVYSMGTDAGDELTYTRVGSYQATENANIDTENRRVGYASSNAGLVKSKLSFNFSSNRNLLQGFLPTVASYAGSLSTSDAVGNAKNAGLVTETGVKPLENSKYDSAQTVAPLTATLQVSDNYDTMQSYSIGDTHDYKHQVDDECDDRDESNEEIAPYYTTQGTFGGYLVAETPYTGKENRTEVPAPSQTNTTTTYWIPVSKQLEIYPYYTMEYEDPNGGTTDVPILSKTPVKVNTLIKVEVSEDSGFNALKLKAVFTRGTSDTIAAGSAFQYLATGDQLEKTFNVYYIVADKDYVANAEDYNNAVETMLEDFKTSLGSSSNLKSGLVTNIPYAATSTSDSRYKIKFDGSLTASVSSSNSRKSSDSPSINLVNISGFEDQLEKSKTGKDAWMNESFILANALSTYRKNYTVSITPSNSNTVVLHLDCDSSSDENATNHAPYDDNSSYTNVDGLNEKTVGTYTSDTDKFIVQRGTAKPYQFGSSIVIKGTPVMGTTTIPYTTYSNPVYFKASGTAYDYRE